MAASEITALLIPDAVTVETHDRPVQKKVIISTTTRMPAQTILATERSGTAHGTLQPLEVYHICDALTVRLLNCAIQTRYTPAGALLFSLLLIIFETILEAADGALTFESDLKEIQIFALTSSDAI